MGAWIADFIEQTDLNKYPVALRTEGGIGFKVGNNTVSSFVGHPVHYVENRELKPITLDWIPSTGEFEGSWYGWDGENVTYCGFILFKPQSVTFNGVARSLNFFRSGNRLISDVAGVGTYEIIISESGCRELLTIPDPIEGELSFQVLQAPGWEECLYIQPRKMLGYEQSGDVYQLTLDMNYPVVIDPDYSGTTGDGQINGYDASYTVCRNTSSNFDITSNNFGVGQRISGNYVTYRGFLKIDTSGIPDADTITQVNLKAVMLTDNSTTDFDVVIKKYNWSATDPISGANRETPYDGCLAATADDNIWKNTASLSINTQYTSGDLNTTWVSKTGYTYYGLISSRDVSNTAPTNNEYIFIASQDHATSGYRPVLTVAHAAISSRSGRLSLLGVG